MIATEKKSIIFGMGGSGTRIVERLVHGGDGGPNDNRQLMDFCDLHKKIGFTDGQESLRPAVDALGQIYGKAPRAMAFTPILSKALKDTHQFILVVRDGRDIAFGKNQAMFRDWGVMANAQPLPTINEAIGHFWSIANLWTLEHLKKNGADFQVMRFEDVVRERPEPWIRDPGTIGRWRALASPEFQERLNVVTRAAREVFDYA